MMKFGKAISDNLKASYSVAFTVGSIILVIMLFLSDWNIMVLSDTELFIYAAGVSGVSMKFLSGTGIMLTYASVTSIAFQMNSEWLKGSTEHARRFKLLLIIPVIIIVVYGVYKIYTALYPGEFSFVEALFGPELVSLLDNLILLWGIWSIMIMIYAIPAIQGSYEPEYEKSTMEKIKERISKAKFSLWKGYQSKVWKEYGKVYAEEFKNYSVRMEQIRLQLSGVILPLLCIILIPFPPLLAIAIILWIRVLTVAEKPLTTAERGTLVFLVLSVILISTWFFIFFGPNPLITTLDIAYGIGLIVNIVVLGIVILRS
ncbi:MAG: conserved membrane protein of unknown function [Candidatus Thorarchaeota archaeon]|nr:MAG: conserved membrane protein of unknown function [Candidatus Thorarchaeota archaeon]